MNKWEATNFCKCMLITLSPLRFNLSKAYAFSLTTLFYISIPNLVYHAPSNGAGIKICLYVLEHHLAIQIQIRQLGRKVMWKHGVFVCSPSVYLILLADCLERDSPRDQLVVTLFLLTVFGLLLGAGVKNRMMKAGLSADVSWNTGRRWWEVSMQVT